MLNDSLITLLGRRAFHETRSQDTVDWAVAELVAGRDTPELCVLAGMSNPLNAFEVDAQFQKTLDEMGLVPPDEAACLRLYARQIAKTLLDGAISIPDACATLSRIFDASHDDDYIVWVNLHWAWGDISNGYITHYYAAADLTLANFDEIAQMEARRFLPEL